MDAFPHTPQADPAENLRAAPPAAEAHAGIEGHPHEVSLRGGVAGNPQRHQILSPGDNAFRKEKAGHKFLVVSRSAKSDAEGVPSRAHLQRLFRCEVVFHARSLAVLPLRHLREFDVAAFPWHELIILRSVWISCCARDSRRLGRAQRWRARSIFRG